VNPLRPKARRLLDKTLLRGAHERADILAMHTLAPLTGGYLPWSRSAMRPSAVVAILNDVVLHQRGRVVELGGGISTLLLGRLLRRTDGRLWTVEHDPVWIDTLTKELGREGLADVVTVIHAPLGPTTAGWGDGDEWYDADALAPLLTGDPVDLLIVDGPPAYRKGMRHARYPALPFFGPALAENATVVLDDIRRRGELEIVERWERESGRRFGRRYVEGNIAITRTGGIRV